MCEGILILIGKAKVFALFAFFYDNYTKIIVNTVAIFP